MTCIVALSVGNKVVLGGDSAASDEKSGLILQTTDPKVFKVGQFGIGFVDSFRIKFYNIIGLHQFTSQLLVIKT
jgi:hypothetical protein